MRSSRSHSSVAKKLSATALSYASPTLPIEGRTPSCSQREAHLAVFEWIEGWYNLHRRHSSIGYLSPNEYERRHAVAGGLGGSAPEPPFMSESKTEQEGLALESGQPSTEPR